LIIKGLVCAAQNRGLGWRRRLALAPSYLCLSLTRAIRIVVDSLEILYRSIFL